MPHLKRLHIVLLLGTTIMFLGCNMNEERAASASQPIEEAEEVEAVNADDNSLEKLTSGDTAYLDGLVNELSGIDRFFVRGSHKRLLAILDRKGDEHASRVRELLEKGSDNEPRYYLERYEPANGYLAYTPGAVEVFVDMVYWNTSDGTQLIATQSRSCGPVCDMEISFEEYKGGTYRKVEAVIPDQVMLSEKLVPGSTTDDSEPYEFYFKFPVNGKDLQYCIGEECLILEWNDGSFVLRG